MNDKTHFGYQTVETGKKKEMVSAVFDSVATSYDVMNDLMSMGIHRVWKRYAINQSGVRYGQTVLDLAGGTGDIAAKLSERVGPNGFVVLADINQSMVMVGRDRLIDRGIVGNLHYSLADAEQLPYAENTFDCVTMAFGLRNVTDKQQALHSIYAALRPGGRLLVLEFSKPVLPLLEKVYDAYSFSVLPALGKLVAADAGSYRYLAESIRQHPDQDTLLGMMQTAGFERCDYHNMTGGIVALHKGFKF